MLATDLHAGNVLRAEREPWLVIDPKPVVGDRSYDATQHLLNCRTRLLSDPAGTMQRFADLLQVDYERVRQWTLPDLRSSQVPRELTRARPSREELRPDERDVAAQLNVEPVTNLASLGFRRLTFIRYAAMPQCRGLIAALP
jgi:aminoglycoside phosphotransferase (APT) family kinase protein